MPKAPATLSRIMAVVEIPMGGHIGHRVLHTFRQPLASEKGFYRSLTSFESFQRGKPPKKGAVPWNHPQFPGQFKPPSWRADRMFNCNHFTFEDYLDDAERQFTRSYRCGYRPWDERVGPVVHHDDLWAFYDHIGWDYKNRVYRDHA